MIDQRVAAEKTPWRVLHLEDDPDYSDFVKTTLEQNGIKAEVTVVDNEQDFQAALAGTQFDLILADYLLPNYTGVQALRWARPRCPETPFLLVSGTIGEQAAIESLKSGATDYVLKHWPDRLVPAVRRAVHEAQERKQRKHAETELVRREKYFRALTDNLLDVVSILNSEGIFQYNSPSLRRVLGYAPAEVAGHSVFSFVHPDDVEEVRLAFRRRVAELEHSARTEFRFRHADGSWRYLEAIGHNLLSDPDIAGVIINTRDITDRKQAEEHLRENEQHYRLIFQDHPTPVWVFDLQTLEFLEVNDAAIEQYGYSREEFLGMKVSAIPPVEDMPMVLTCLDRIRSGLAQDGSNGDRAWRHRRKDGTVFDAEIRWTAISAKGRAAVLAMAHDVTERRRVERRDAAFSKLGQALSSATTPADAANTIKVAAEELFGWDAFTLDLYSDEKDLIQPVLNVDTIDGQRAVLAITDTPRKPSRRARRIIEQGAELQLRDEPLVLPDDVIPFGDLKRPSASLMLVPLRNGERVIGVLSIQSYKFKAYSSRDLSALQTVADYCGAALERIRAEQAQRESEQRFRDLFEGSPDAVFVEDLEGRVLDVNPAACRLHGMERADLIGKTVSDLVPPERREGILHDFQKLVTGELNRVEGLSWTKENWAVPVEVRASRINYGGHAAILLHVRDITEQKNAESALRSSEMLFHSVWENSVDGMRLTDQDGTIVAVNDAFCKLVSMERTELEGRPFTIVYADSEDHEKTLAQYQKRFQERVVWTEDERRLTLHNGNTVVLENTNSFVELRGQRPLLLGLFRDVTMQKRLEEQLRQSQKMEAIGQLAGGVAHDFNNILTVIGGHASLLLNNKLESPTAKSAHQIAQATERAAGLTRQLLTFSRRQVMQPCRLDMNEVVSNMTKMLGRLLGEDVTLHLTYWDQPSLVQADASMMEQVLLNLAVNSRDAMPKGGQLAIKIAVVDIDAAHVAHHPEARAGRFVCLTAADTGCGIPPENLRRIFEPFFTTKQLGKGTGLGLATVYGIVKQHQGWIEVESRVGKGTTFRVYLPKSQESTKAAQEKPAETPVRGGSETILLVEDETPVRELVSAILTGRGYNVLQAESGPKALEVWKQKRDDIDLLLTDLVMPERMNGRELAEKLWTDRPKLKVIFTSGYSADVVGKDFVLKQGLHYLQKPYHPQKLALAVRDCLDA